MVLEVVNKGFVAVFAQIIEFYLVGVRCPPKVKQRELTCLHLAPTWPCCQHSLNEFMIVTFIQIKSIPFHLRLGCIFCELIVLIVDLLSFIGNLDCLLVDNTVLIIVIGAISERISDLIGVEPLE